MFGPVQPTEMDLQFRLFGIPVRVLPWFWILAALLGSNLLRSGWEYLLVWIVVVFFSILFHELGHALVARLFGYYPRIFLHHFGGMAMYTPDADYTAGRAILITFAGPAFGFVLGFASIAVTALLVFLETPVQPLVSVTLAFLIEVNIWWSILNLLPVIPLDGGQITRDVCTSINPSRGETWSLWISVFAAGAVGLLAFSLRQTYLGFLFALMCYQNFQMLQHWRYYR